MCLGSGFGGDGAGWRGVGGADEYGSTTVTCDRRESGGSRRWWFGRRAIGVEMEWEVRRGSRHPRAGGQRAGDSEETGGGAAGRGRRLAD